MIYNSKTCNGILNTGLNLGFGQIEILKHKLKLVTLKLHLLFGAATHLTHTKICQPHFLGSQAKSENLLFFLSSRDFNFFGKRSLLSFSPLLLVNFRNDVCKVSKKRGKP